MKKVWKTISIMIAAIILTGCMKMNVKVVIEDENNASMVMEAYYSKEMLDSYGADPDEAFGQLKSGKYEDWQTKDINKKIDGKEYVGVEMTAPAKECKDILDNLTVDKKDNSKEYTFTMSSNNLNDFGDTESLEGAGYSIEQMKSLGLEMTMTIEMPGKIESASLGEIDGNTVTIDLLDMANANVNNIEIVAKESTSANAMYLYLAGGVAIVAIIAITMIIMKKKKASVENVATETVTSTSNEEPVQVQPTVEKAQEAEVKEEPVTETNEETMSSVEETANEDPIEETSPEDTEENKE